MATDRCDEDELDGWHASDLEIDVDAGTKGKPRTERGASSGSALLAGVDTKKSSKQLPVEIDESLAPRTGAADANTMKQKLAALRGKMVENGRGFDQCWLFGGRHEDLRLRADEAKGEELPGREAGCLPQQRRRSFGAPTTVRGERVTTLEEMSKLNKSMQEVRRENDGHVNFTEGSLRISQSAAKAAERQLENPLPVHFRRFESIWRVAAGRARWTTRSGKMLTYRRQSPPKGRGRGVSKRRQRAADFWK